MKQAALLLLILAASVPAVAAKATASPADLAFDSGIPIKVQGDLAAEAGPNTLLTTGDAGSLAVSIEATSIEVKTLRVIREFQTLASGTRLLENQRTEEASGTHPDARLVLVERRPGFLLTSASSDAAWTSNVARAPDAFTWSNANAQISLLLHEKPLAPTAAAGSDLLPRSLLELRSDHVVAESSPQELTWYDGTFEIQSRGQAPVRLPSQPTTQLVPGAIWTPDLSGTGAGAWLGPGTHVEETLAYHRASLSGARTHLEASQQPVLLYTEDLRLNLEGFAGLPWARGMLHVAGSPRTVAGEQVVLGGSFALDVEDSTVGQVHAIRLDGSGDLTFLQIGAAPAAFPLGAAAAGSGVALAAAGLGAAAYYGPLLKWAGSGLVAPLYARLPRDRILDHQSREILYERIRNEPGISTNRLADAFPVGWSTLAYHLRVLERNEKVVSVRDGRYRRFFDRESGHYANGRKFVVAVLKNDATHAIGRLVQSRPGLTQKDVSQHFGLAPSSIHWHIERLSEARLVEKRRQGHFVRYTPGPAWAEVRPEDLGTAGPPLSTTGSPTPAFHGAPPDLAP